MYCSESSPADNAGRGCEELRHDLENTTGMFPDLPF
jgi:hypothetical protein